MTSRQQKLIENYIRVKVRKMLSEGNNQNDIKILKSAYSSLQQVLQSWEDFKNQTNERYWGFSQQEEQSIENILSAIQRNIQKL